jgi:very-short-patch-repair endonuclease
MIRNQLYTKTKLALAKKFRHEMTPAEEKFWLAVKGNKAGGWHFRRQQIIDGFIADFYCRKLKLVVELDEGIHEKQKDYDQERDRVFRTDGIVVWRFSNQDILNLLFPLVFAKG